MGRRTWKATALVAALAVSAAVVTVVPGGAAPLPGATACPIFPADSFWHADVSALPVHAQSAGWVTSIGSAAALKADFGSGTWNGGPIGIPFTTVPGTQPRVPVSFGYADESDPGPYPIPPDAPIEGGPAATGDRHVLVVDRDACRLSELYSYDISRFSPADQVILRALKTHGMVLADNGSPWFLSGAPDARWDDSDLNLLRGVAGSAFEAVDVTSLKVASTSYAVNVPGTTTTSTAAPTTTSSTSSSTTSTSTTTTTAPTGDLVANPGFESSLAGWGAGNRGTSVARSCTGGHSGSCSAEIGRSKQAGDATIDDFPDTVPSSAAGRAYSASAWVQAPAGRSVALRVREYRSIGVRQSRVAVATGTGAWQQLAVTSVPAAGGTTISVDVTVASLPTGVSARVDDVSLRAA